MNTTHTRISKTDHQAIVQAGFPSPEEEALCDVISMDEYLITRPESSFLLQVSGDSMIGEGIMEGDLVIAEKGRIIILKGVQNDYRSNYVFKPYKKTPGNLQN